MSKVLFFFIFLTSLSKSDLYAQYKTDTWFCGYLEPGNTDRDSIYKLQIISGKPIVTYSTTLHSFESTFASISDSSGHLLLYTNGCMVADSNNQIIVNGDGLNAGPMASELCGNYGYISEMGAVFIPVPDHPNDFWLIHMALERDTLLKVKYGPLYASYIDGSNGKYSVTIKNQVLLKANLERFAVVKHGNGRDWWIIVPKYSTNEYHKFLITSKEIEEKDIQNTGPIFDFKYCANGRGANAFSNSGKYYARYNVSCGPVIFNFDRCTGNLVDPLYFTPTTKQFGGGGIAFNPGDTKMYYSTQNNIYKIDLAAIPPSSNEIVKGASTYSSTLGDMFTGPDSNIYIRAQSSSFNIHVLHPDFITSKEDSFKIKAINLPARNTRTLPFTINYALGPVKNSDCDSLLTSTSLIKVKSLVVYPNPAEHSIKIDVNALYLTGELYISLYRLNGELVFHKKIENTDNQAIDLNELSPGYYLIKLINNSVSYTAKIIVQR